MNDTVNPENIERALIMGDLAGLTPEERLAYYKQVCESVGLNPLTKPFEYIKLNGKLVLYPLRGTAEQLRKLNKVSISIAEKAMLEGGNHYMVRAVASDQFGRKDEAIAVVTMRYPMKYKDQNGNRKDHPKGGKPLDGEDFANQIMKCECVPLDSEILTRNGFRRYDQINIGDEVLAYDYGADRCVWTPLIGVSVYPSAPVVRLSSTKGQFSALCTPDHSWAIRKGSYKANSGPRGPYANRQPDRRLVKTGELKTSHSIVLAAPLDAEEDSVLTPTEAAILGWAVTDGTIQRRGSHVRVGICQSKEENFDAIRAIVGDVREIVSPARTRTFPMSGRTYATKEQHWWYLPSAIGRALLAKAGFMTRADLPKIVTRLNAPARAAMLQAFMLAEGDKRLIFANGDPAIMEAFDILCALQGHASGQQKAKDTIWTKRLKKTRHVAGSFLLKPEAIGNAAVWCPTTAFGTWVMRQGGRVMITGNTKAKRRVTLSICGLGMLDETEVETVANAETPEVGHSSVLDQFESQGTKQLAKPTETPMAPVEAKQTVREPVTREPVASEPERGPSFYKGKPLAAANTAEDVEANRRSLEEFERVHGIEQRQPDQIVDEETGEVTEIDEREPEPEEPTADNSANATVVEQVEPLLPQPPANIKEQLANNRWVGWLDWFVTTIQGMERDPARAFANAWDNEIAVVVRYGGKHSKRLKDILQEKGII